MNRLVKVRIIINRILDDQLDLELKNHGYVHLYAVSSFCNLLALKRGINSELCTIAGMLHDIYTYKTGNSTDHAILGSIEARKILNEINCFSDNEIDIICKAIYNHSNKLDIDGIYDELLKDADTLHHYLHNIDTKVAKKEKSRLKNLIKELKIDN